MIKQRAFFFSYAGNPGLGILAENAEEGWRRINFYAFGLNADELQRGLAAYHNAKGEGEGKLQGVPAQSKAVLAGGDGLQGADLLAASGCPPRRGPG